MMKLRAKMIDRRYLLALVMFASALALVSSSYLLKHKVNIYQRSRWGSHYKGSNTAHRSDGKAAIHMPDLQISSVIHHGRIIEVEGSTEAGAVVMINGEPAATLFDNNTFKHFIGPLLPGPNVVTVTIQNDQGGVTTRQLLVSVE